MPARIIFILSLMVVLNGCVAVWGDSYKIETQTPNLMTVHYDTTFIEKQKIMEMAREHCAQFGKQAVLETDNRSFSGISTANFLCKDQAEYRP